MFWRYSIYFNFYLQFPVVENNLSDGTDHTDVARYQTCDSR
jgi:hypothetical protein